MTALAERIKGRIRSEGPMTLSAFMAEALFDPTEGFYATRDPIGAGADFVTAPEISQMFGELIGLWCVQAWRDMGAPPRLSLIELGPGKGTMMADMLRAARLDPDFVRAARVFLVEASPALKTVQGRSLEASPCPIAWIGAVEDAPETPALIVGNEYLDCLPIRQFLMTPDGWRERLAGLDPDGERVAYVLSNAAPHPDDVALIPESLREAEPGTVAEIRPASAPLAAHLGERFATKPGRALFIDYGPAQSEGGDTLQAIAKHEKTDPLAEPGGADLTARVDFAALADAARAAGLDVAGPVTQAAFLTALGVEHRAAALSQKQEGAERSKIARQLFRLTGDDQMGALFKAICLSSEGLPAPAGFA